MEGIQYASFGKLIYGKKDEEAGHFCNFEREVAAWEGGLWEGGEGGRVGGQIVTLTGGASSSSCRTDPKFSGAIVQLKT